MPRYYILNGCKAIRLPITLGLLHDRSGNLSRIQFEFVIGLIMRE